MPRQPSIDFRNIREHAGSQYRGFEELVYQLMPWLDDIGGLARQARW
jgi:hypothetical protein